MLCTCMLAIAMLVGGTHHPSSSLQQDSDKSSAPPPTSPSPQNSPPSPTSPPANPSEAPPADQGESTPPNDTSGKPKETQPEEKKAAPCAGKNGSTKGKCKSATSQGRRVVRHGSTGEPTAQLAPGMTAGEALRDRKYTEQLLSSTEGNLRRLASRNLNQNQHDTVSQIRNYMAGSRSALQTGDLSRAHNLAFKAHLLADDLMGH